MRLCNGEQMSYEEKRTVLQKIGLGLPLDGKGVGPNVARSAEDWNDFRKFHKKHNPFRYFINNDFESVFIWPWSMPLQRAKEWVQYRTTRRYHVVNTGMEPGYADLTEKLLHVNFNMLKDFVEKEKGSMWQYHEASSKYDKQPGVSYLIWEIGLDADNSINNQQSANALEQYELYNWWTNIRPFRVDSFETPEHKAYWKLRDEIYGSDCFFCEDKDTPELKKAQKAAYELSDTLDKQYSKEDEDNLIRLMKIRQSLWT